MFSEDIILPKEVLKGVISFFFLINYFSFDKKKKRKTQNMPIQKELTHDCVRLLVAQMSYQYVGGVDIF